MNKWASKMQYINKILELPYFAEYESPNGIKFLLSHAGYTPGEFWDKKDAYAKEQASLWSRSHMNFSWPEKGYENVVIVHGHTPILYQKTILPKFKNASGMSPYLYEDGHKINLDAATANTGLAFLLNLDNYDYEIFIVDMPTKIK